MADAPVGRELQLEHCRLGGGHEPVVAECVPPIRLRRVDGVPRQRAGKPLGVPWSKTMSTGGAVEGAQTLSHEFEDSGYLFARFRRPVLCFGPTLLRLIMRFQGVAYRERAAGDGRSAQRRESIRVVC